VKQFCSDFQAMLDEDNFVGKLVFSGEATFHFDGKLNCITAVFGVLKIRM
jgi:hypothetical protein